jgi:hypothetical protein
MCERGIPLPRLATSRHQILFPQATTRLEHSMFRIIAALFLLLASAAASSAQGLFPSVWQSQRGALLKVLAADPTGNFTGVFVSGPAGTCPGVPYDLAGRVRGPRVIFQTSRNWTTDCRATTVWSGRFVSPTTVVTRGIATYVSPDGRVRRVQGTEVFQRI